MNVRAMQIWGFLFNVLGWIFVACTMAMEFWKISGIGGQGGSNIMKVAWYWSSLWRSCFTDSTAITSCIDFPVLWSVEDYIQVVRALLMSALCMGVLAFVLSFMGLECTYIGGKEPGKRKLLISGAFLHILSGLLSFTGYVCYAHQVSAEYFNPNFIGLRFELGTPLFLGWVGSVFEITGGTFYCISINFAKTNVSLSEVSSVSDFHSNVSDAESSVTSESGRPGNKKLKTTYI
uniref:Claudin 10e n=1 Tax=Scleropages formosus TaxID=113540 RepID=A0A8C9R423_SCLFO